MNLIDARSVEIGLLGPMRVLGPKGVLNGSDFPTRKARQMCAVLAIACGAPVSKDRLVDLLWGEKLPRDPYATVDHSATLLRSALSTVSDAPIIVVEKGRYRVDVKVASIDLIEFDGLVARAAASIGSFGLQCLRAADELVGGDLLETEPDAVWLRSTRDRYREDHRAVLLGIARRSLATDDATSACEAARRARLGAELALEDAYSLEIAGLIRLGRRHTARRLMHELEQRLSDESGALLGAEASSLRTFLRESTEHASANAAWSVKTALRADFDEPPFVARTAQLDAVASAISSARDHENQLLIVEGPAGTGKTRLLRQISQSDHGMAVHTFECLPSDQDCALLSASRLLRQLARAAGVQPSSDTGGDAASMFGRLADHLDLLGPTLLLVDDVHHMDAESQAVVRSLVGPGAVESLCIVATTRPSWSDDAPTVLRVGMPTIALRSLTEHDVESFAIDNAWAETGGHPATIMACIEGARRGGDLTPEGNRSVLDRVEEAGGLALIVLPIAASLDQPFAVEDVAYAAGLAGGTIANWIERPRSLGLLRTVDSGSFEFADDVLRRSLARLR